MANVAGVHGISEQQSGRNQLQAAWLPSLRDGVERAVGRAGPAVELDIGYYADLYGATVSTKKGVTPHELDAGELAFLRGDRGRARRHRPA